MIWRKIISTRLEVDNLRSSRNRRSAVICWKIFLAIVLAENDGWVFAGETAMIMMLVTETVAFETMTCNPFSHIHSFIHPHTHSGRKLKFPSQFWSRSSIIACSKNIITHFRINNKMSKLIITLTQWAVHNRHKYFARRASHRCCWWVCQSERVRVLWQLVVVFEVQLAVVVVE